MAVRQQRRVGFALHDYAKCRNRRNCITESNYIITYATGNLTVNGAALTVTASLESKTYGQTVAFGGRSNIFLPALACKTEKRLEQ